MFEMLSDMAGITYPTSKKKCGRLAGPHTQIDHRQDGDNQTIHGRAQVEETA
jgi:hypothetical protein